MQSTLEVAGTWALRGVTLAAAVLLGVVPPPPVQASPQSPDLASPASPVIRVLEEVYDIRGSTAEELHREMQRLGPPAEDGRRFYGHTAWNIRWRFLVEPSGNSCRATRVEVTAYIVLTLPRWTPPQEAPEELRHRWDAFMAALRAHEEGHRDLAVAAARRVHSRISGFRTASCRDFNREVNREGERILDRLRTDNLRYDEETRHGMAQGAEWPPPPHGLPAYRARNVSTPSCAPATVCASAGIVPTRTARSSGAPTTR